MGLLDDAIREHLDLKRRRGADPTEIERAEHEALGPVRRGEVDLDDSPARDEPLPRYQDAWDAGDDPELEDDEVATAAPDEPAAYRYEPEDDEEPEPAPRADPEPAAAEAPAVDEPPELEDDEHQGQATREFSAHELDEALGQRARGDDRPFAGEDAAPAEGEPDVLGETPDFLQETPEHDRLWFEQKPPKDFDF